MDERFGRAKGFVLYDEESNQLSWFSNEENIDTPHGAGIQAAQLVVNIKAEILITGRIGPKAHDVLKKANIKIYEAVNINLKQAYKSLQEGMLTQI